MNYAQLKRSLRAPSASLLTSLLAPTIALPSGAWADIASPRPERYSFKAATVAPEGTPWASLFNRFRREVRRASQGRLRARIFLGGVKGDERSIMRQVVAGRLQMGGLSTGAIASIVPDLDILELPYAFATAAQADQLLEEARPLIRELLHERGLELIMYSENGYRSFGANRCIRQPSDLRGMKMRSQENEVHLETYRALGASPNPIAVGEVLSSLQTGHVTGFDNTPLFTQAVSWHQAVTHYSTTRHIYQPALILANKAWFDELPPSMRSILLEKAQALEARGRQQVRALEAPLIANFGEQGVEVCELSDAERARFRDATRSVWTSRRARASEKGRQLLDMMQRLRGN